MQLEFFRKYQRFLFLIITIVIIISFSFFGTYSTLSAPMHGDQIAFTAVDGTKVTRSELEEMALFLRTDMIDKNQLGGVWGPNFFNDGVITQDFLTTGLAHILAMQFKGDLQADLAPRLEKEKRFPLYVHPQAKFVGAETVWSHFAPQLKNNLDSLRTQDNAISPEAVLARINLYLSEKQFPQSSLRQVLHYQQQQYRWLLPDENLDRTDLSLFGYHTLDDWFGPTFLRLISEFIINSAKIAEERGYRVTKDEALASLIHNSQLSFEQNRSSPYLGVSSSEEYFQEQLRRMGMDQSKAIKLWTQVLLFRRLFHGFGNSMFLSPFFYKNMEEYANQFISGDLYRLPQDLRFGNFSAMQKLEIYLNAISKRPDEKAVLDLPKEFLPITEVESKTPELVQKRYLVDIAQVDKRSLQAKVGIKETWKWEMEKQNWDLLTKNFPELGIKKADTSEERFAILESLDDKTRAKVDTFSRLAIVDQHPEWLQSALEEASPKRMTLGLRKKGGTLPISGIENTERLGQLLDLAPKGTQVIAASKESEEAQKLLDHFSEDQRNYYRIRVIDRDAQPQILTFAEASNDGTLDVLLNDQLEAYYKEIRETNPALYQKEDKSWKELADVKDSIAHQYFVKIIDAIKKDAKEWDRKTVELVNDDLVASRRLNHYMRKARREIEMNPIGASAWYQEPKEPEIAIDTLTVVPPLQDQWRLEKNPYRLSQSTHDNFLLDKDQAFTLTVNEWSTLFLPPNGDVVFFALKEKGVDISNKKIADKVYQGQQILSAEAQRALMRQVLGLISDKGAISLDYLRKNVGESIEPEASS